MVCNIIHLVTHADRDIKHLSHTLGPKQAEISTTVVEHCPQCTVQFDTVLIVCNIIHLFTCRDTKHLIQALMTQTSRDFDNSG